MRRGVRGLSISLKPVKGITGAALYKRLIRMYLFVPSEPIRNWPLHAYGDFVQSGCNCKHRNMSSPRQSLPSAWGASMSSLLFPSAVPVGPLQHVAFSIFSHSWQTGGFLTLPSWFMYNSRCISSVWLNREQRCKLLSAQVYQSLAW